MAAPSVLESELEWLEKKTQPSREEMLMVEKGKCQQFFGSVTEELLSRQSSLMRSIRRIVDTISYQQEGGKPFWKNRDEKAWFQSFSSLQRHFQVRLEAQSQVLGVLERHIPELGLFFSHLRGALKLGMKSNTDKCPHLCIKSLEGLSLQQKGMDTSQAINIIKDLESIDPDTKRILRESGIPLPDKLDEKSKPQKIVGEILSAFGFKRKSKKVTIKGTRERIYYIDLESLKEIFQLSMAYVKKTAQRIETFCSRHLLHHKSILQRWVEFNEEKNKKFQLPPPPTGLIFHEARA